MKFTILVFVASVAIAAASVIPEANQEAEATFSERTLISKNKTKDGSTLTADQALPTTIEIPGNKSSQTNTNETAATPAPTVAFPSETNDTAAESLDLCHKKADQPRPVDDEQGIVVTGQSLSRSKKPSPGTRKRKLKMALKRPSSKGQGCRRNFNKKRARVVPRTRDTTNKLLTIILIAVLLVVKVALLIFLIYIRFCHQTKNI